MGVAVRRKRYFIKGSLQVKYLRFIILSMIFPVLLVSGCLYYLIFNIVAQEIAIPESIAYTLFPAVRRVNIIILIGFPVIFIIMLIWAILLSHRIAGPIHRLQKELERISKGDFSVRIKFRRKDEIGQIAEGINKVLDKIQNK